MLAAKFPFSFPLEQTECIIKRDQILSELCAMDEGFSSIPVTSVKQETLDTMLIRYDELFFDGYLHRVYGKIRITLSSRLTSSAGKFIIIRGLFGRIEDTEIRMSSDFLMRLKEGPFNLNGLIANIPQEAFLIVFEHELCHAIEAAMFKHSGHSQRFLSIANGVFGHTSVSHRLPTRRQEAADAGLYVGSKVHFFYKNKLLHGTITYIGKNITVMVPSSFGSYKDRFGRHYEKYRLSPDKLLFLDK